MVCCCFEFVVLIVCDSLVCLNIISVVVVVVVVGHKFVLKVWYINYVKKSMNKHDLGLSYMLCSRSAI